MPTKVLLISIFTNVWLTLFKTIGGVMTGSTGLVADGFHSLTDVISMTANYFGMKTSLRPANGLRAYDNYKREVIGTFIVSFALFGIGLLILVRSYLSLTSGMARSPGVGAAVFVVVAFIITYALYLYSKKVSEKSDSPGLAVNTEQIKLNVLSTVAVVIGIAGSFFGMSYLDPVAAIVVAGIILYSSIEIVHGFLMETAEARLSTKQVDEIKALVAETVPMLRVARMKTMVIRRKVWLLLELVAPPETPVGRDIVQTLKCSLLSKLLYLANVIVDVVPGRTNRPLKVEIEDFGRELREARNYLSVVFIVVLLLLVSISAFGISFWARQYHVLLPADVPDINTCVSTRLGRAPYFYLYRIDKQKGRFVENRSAAALGDVDVDRKVAKWMKDYCVEAVVTENVGPLIFEQLNRANITLYKADPTLSIRQQIDEFRKGDLKTLTGPNVDAKFAVRNFRMLHPWYNWEPQR